MFPNRNTNGYFSGNNAHIISILTPPMKIITKNRRPEHLGKMNPQLMLAPRPREQFQIRQYSVHISGGLFQHDDFRFGRMTINLRMDHEIFTNMARGIVVNFTDDNRSLFFDHRFFLSRRVQFRPMHGVSWS